MRVLFQTHYLQFDFIICILWVIGVVYAIHYCVSHYRKNQQPGLFITLVVCVVFGSFAVYASVQLVRATVFMIATASRTDYQTAVGYVEDYQLTPAGAHDNESFEIDGVRFAYPPAGNVWFYQTVRSAGGVVRGNGQFLEIHYFPMNVKQGNRTVAMNCIIYIAEDESKSIDSLDDTAIVGPTESGKPGAHSGT